ncbi:MAG TPA: hypothetical protein VLW25_15460 [Bryobacteraceae bacterium]|nr:hypothetical protein [Bryobacteraceae bacterium]
MPKPRLFLPILTVLLVPAMLCAADPGLLRLVMPDAKVIAGLQVDRTRDSAFGQFVLSHMQLSDESFQKLIAETGFDPRRDVSELMIASNWESSSPESRWLVLAKGAFDLQKIQAAAQLNGATITNFQGAPVYSYSGSTGPDSDSAITFLDASSAVMGDMTSVKAALTRQRSSAPASSDLLKKVGPVSAKNDFWFVTLVPLSEFAGAMPNPNLSSAMQGNVLNGINQASGGIHFGDTVTISAEAITRSDKDAQALVDVVKFVASMLQLNRQDNPTAGQVSSLLDTLDTKTTGNVMSMSLVIPEQQLEQLFQNLQRPPRPATKRAAPQVN